VAVRLGIGQGCLLNWVKRDRIDQGERPRLTTRERAYLVAPKVGVSVSSIKIPRVNTNTRQRAARAIFGFSDLPTAIFWANDRVAFGLSCRLLSRRIRVSEQVSIIGYGDVQIVPSAVVPPSSVTQPSYQLEVTATELLLSEYKDAQNHAYPQVLFQPQLVTRSSTATAPMGAATSI
jgi:LacI family transcriptional regulator